MEPRLAEKPSLTLSRRYPVAPEKVYRRGPTRKR
jgi:hypothetical protein